MQEKTIENMTHVLKKIERNEYSQEEVVGIVPFTPIQKEFKNWKLSNESHFNQDIMLRRKVFDEVAVREALKEIVKHHDILRAVYKNNAMEILPISQSNLFDMKVYDLKNISDEEIDIEIWNKSTEIQKTINLQSGPLMKVILFKLKEECRLIICIHHLIVDGVSWRIIIEDFEKAYNQYLNKETITLPKKTASYKEWAESLEDYKNSEILSYEYNYWKDIDKCIDEGAIIGDNNGIDEFDTTITSMNEEETQKIIYKCNKKYGTDTNELLISSLVLAINKITNQEKLAISLEGHGREKIHKKIDVSRTVGWFTSIYPVALTTDGIVENTIISTKETIRRIPNKGIGYSVIKYSNDKNEFKEIPKVCFNYLGDFDNLVSSNENIDEGITTSFMATGETSSRENKNNYDFVLNIKIEQKKLQVFVTYNKGKFTKEFIDKFNDNYVKVLKEIIEICLKDEKVIKTPCDYGLFDMTESELRLIEKAKGVDNIENIYPLTPMQEGMLYHKLLDRNSTAYTVQDVFELNGSIDLDKLIEAFDVILYKHEVLRTSIMFNGLEKHKQVILKNRKIQYFVIDISSEENLEEIIEEIKKNDIKEGFDLENDSLFRIKILKQAKDKYKMIMTFHHIIIDGWCMPIIISDILDYYQQLVSGVNKIELIKEISKLRLTKYSDYINEIESKRQEKALDYWNNLLKDYDELVGIPKLGTKTINNDEDTSLELKIDLKTTNKVKQISTVENVTISTILETVWGVLLQKYNITDNVVFGKVVSGRNVDLKDIDKTVGLFINTIPVKVRSDKQTTFKELLHSMQIQNIESMKYDFCSLADIQGNLNRKELFDTIMVFENYYSDESKIQAGLKNIDIKVESNREKTNYPISICINLIDTLNIKLIYDSNMYSYFEANNILKTLQGILIQIVDNINIKIKDIELVTENEKNKILNDFNNVNEKYCKNITIKEAFEEVVANTPEKTAVVLEEEEVTYRELNERANKLARKLRNKGINPNEYVGIIAERKIETIIGIFGVLKAGAAYLPIDSKYPKERIKYMLEESKAKVLLISNNIEIDMDIEKINISDDNETCMLSGENLETYNKANDLAYLIYTSGTTGKPKGVMLENNGVINLRDYFIKDFNISEKDVILQFANFVFDASVWEMTMGLLTGATLCMISNETIQDINKFERYIKDKGVTVLTLPPQYCSQVNLDNVRLLITAGSESNNIILERNKNIRYVNAYGPTENTVCATAWERKNNVIDERIPIGKPILNNKAYILNDEKLCGIGMIGELCITGPGIARGYLNREDLTREKFIENPYREGEKVYRTGDLARWLPDGNIEYLGRIDEQVKIRGYRIELGEIESVIREEKEIKDVAVIVKSDSSKDKYICCYIVSDIKICIDELKKSIKAKLAEYMIPTYIMQIDKIPVTINGKVDKKALSKIKNVNGSKYIKPRNILEENLSKAFKEVLEIEELGIDDNFFELGGHSLKAIKLINAIEKIIGNRIEIKTIFERPTIRSLAESLNKEKNNVYEKITKVEEQEYYEMSSAQKRIYVVGEIDDNKVSYNIPIALKIEGNLDVERLKNAVSKLIERHEIFRTSFHMIDGKAVQKISKNVNINFEYEERFIKDESKLIMEFMRPFDLSKAPLMRVKVIKSTNDSYILLIDIHHIIADGESVSIFMDELSKLYKGEALDEITVSYKDYSYWIKNKDLSNEKEYWINEFKDEIPVLEMPLDYTRGQVQSFNGNILTDVIDKDTSHKISLLSKETKTTEFMILLSALSILLSKYSNQDDIIIGSPIAGRTHKDTEKMIGMFVNTLALRTKPTKNKTYMDFLNEVKQVCLKAFENQQYPLEELIENLDIKRDLSRNPLFDVSFSIQNNNNEMLKLDDLKIGTIKSEYNISKFDMSINIFRCDEFYAISFEYCSDLFKKETIEKMINHYKVIINDIMNNPNKCISDIETVEENEKNKILNDFNNISEKYCKNITIKEEFEEVVANTPEKIAVVLEEEEVTYRELNERANKLARKLRNKGINPNEYVGIIAERKIETIIGIFGVLKAGAAYLPIDSKYPKERIKYMLEESKAKVLLISNNIEIDMDIEKINISDDNETCMLSGENLETYNKANDLAYLIYTSGTTGKPKGVMLENNGVINLRDYFIKDFNISEKDVILQFANFVFDASVWEMTMGLLTGATLCMISNETIQDINKFERYIKDKGVTVLTLPPQYCSQVNLDNVRLLITAGSESNNIILERNKNIRYVNAYGPTENTVCATAWERKNNVIDERIPIGKPILNNKAYILNDEKLCGIGMIGELCITGPGIARGYLNREDLTREKFIENPYREGEKVYRTGDLARWLPDGNIEYLGRIDEQVKIRGYRIELGEIESVIREEKEIKDVAVIIQENDGSNEKLIVAYIVGDKELDIELLKKNLNNKLPEYMIPAYITQIEKIPVTINGKLDKKALPKISLISKTEYVAPRDSLEKELAKVFISVLGVEKVGIRDNFFELGGDSIKAIRAISKIREIGYEITVKDLMKERTIEKIKDKLVVASEKFEYEQGEVTGIVPLTPIQNEFFNWNLTDYNYFNQSVMLKKNNFDEKAVKEAIKEIVVHHDILRAVYNDGKQNILPVKESNLYEFKVVNLTEYSDVELEDAIYNEGNKVQASIDIKSGPLVKAVLFKTKLEDHLLICIHHLVVDGVSFRIIIEDFKNGYAQYIKNNKIELPKKTASYKEWAENLYKYKENKNLLKQKEYWSKVNTEINEGKINGDIKKETAYNDVIFELSEKVTKDLLFSSNKAYNTEINDLLLSSIVIALNKCTKQKKVAIKLESHGREELFANIKIDRTVGWFTNVYPVVLSIGDDIEETIINTKETLRKVPDNGIGYGLLKYSNDKTINNDEIDLCFNYLGDYGNSDSLNINNEEISFSEFKAGEAISIENGKINNITINSSISNNKFSAVITYNKGKYSVEFINNLKASIINSLIDVTNFCKNVKDVIKTPSDFKVYDITKDEFNEIKNKYGIENVDDIYSLTPMQEGMLYHRLLDKTSSSYFLQQVIKFKGNLEIDKVQEAMELLSYKYDVLRTSILSSKKLKKPRQIVLKEKIMEFSQIDISNKEDNLRLFQRIKNDDIERGFDLEDNSLSRVTIVKINKDDYRMIWSFHHIIMDGWCISLILNDFINYYSLLSNGEKKLIIKEKIDSDKKSIANYGDYVRWLENQDTNEALNYWKDLLSEYDNSAEIPSINISSNTESQVEKKSIIIDKKISDSIKTISNKENVTINTILETVWGIMLQKYTRCDDVVFGKVVSGRNAELKNIDKAVGLFINTIPVRVCYNSGLTYKELLNENQKQALESMKYDYCPLAEIQNQSSLKKDLIKTLFVFENYYINEENNVEELQNLQVEIESVREQTNYQITIVSSFIDKLNISAMYDPKIYSEREIEVLLERMNLILEQIVENPEIKISDIQIVTKKEKNKILKEFNDTYLEVNKDKCIHEMFEEQVAKNPNKRALILNDSEMSYGELNEKANKLARFIRSKNIKQDEKVVILTQRTMETIVAIYAVMKAGACYVPIDPTYPIERINYMIEDSEAKLILTEAEGLNIETNVEKVDIKDEKNYEFSGENLENINTPNDLAYIIYTSGTTGKPKGVMIEHRGVINLRDYFVKLYNVNEKDVVLQFANLIFDASVWEMTMSLLTGASLCLVPKEIIENTKKFEKYVREKNVSITILPPAYLAQVDINNVRIITTGGSESNKNIVSKIKNSRYINAYGPTENTVCATHWEKIDDIVPEKIPIGKPISNNKIYILNGNNLCGIGIAGELCVSGPSVARGYLNREELTKEKFVQNPFNKNERMYRTGDLARWLPDGNIEYLGRIDEQVKIRGFRIELGEIENIIRNEENIEDVVAIVKHDVLGENYICAYVTSKVDLSIGEIKKNISQVLPDYMVPTYIMQIPKIPINKSGKVAKNELPEIVQSNLREYVAPRNEGEEKLVKIFNEVLSNTDSIGIKDNFFELGGHSLKAIKLVNAIEEAFGIRLSLKEIFKYPTVESLAELLEDAESIKYKAIEKVEEKDYYEVSSAQKRIYVINELDKNQTTYNIPMIIKAHGNLDVDKIRKALETMVDRHEILRTSFHMVNGEMVQKINKKVDLDFKVSYEEIVDEENKLMINFTKPFDLSKAPLMRAEIIKSSNCDYLMLDIHHIICDAGTMNIFLSELSNLYNDVALEPVKVQYKDYTYWMQDRDLNSQKKYWLDVFSDEIPVLDLPLDYQRGVTQSFNGNTVNRIIDAELKNKVKKLAKETSTTEFMILLSALSILLNKYCRQEDIVIGTPVSGRTHKDTEKTLGMFVNTLALRTKPVNNKKYEEFLNEIKECCLQSFENQEYPFEELVEELNINRDLARNPLFDIMFNLQKSEDVSLKLGDLDLEQVVSSYNVSKFDITITVADYNDIYNLNFEYCSDLFKEETIIRMMEYYNEILKQIVDMPSKIINDFEVINKEDKEKILYEFNNTVTQYPKNSTVKEVFEEIVIKNPNDIAVTFKDKSLTYQELNEKSNSLARILRKKGVGRETFVGLLTERSVEVIVGVLAIIKAGGVYVPIDSNYPKERIDYMLNNSNISIVLTGKEMLDLELSCEFIDLYDEENYKDDSENLENVNEPNDLIYLIYTSGTTGKPKGTMIEHKNVLRLVKNTNYINFNDININILQTGSLSFDASTFEIWGALLNGGRLYLAESEIFTNSQSLKKMIYDNNINIMWLTSALYNQIITDDEETFDGLDYLLIGGEKLSVEHVKKLKNRNKKIHLINGYGPTESTTFATTYEINEVSDIIPIGKPISNTQIYIKNGNGLSGIGVPGELCIAGDGLSRGYLNQIEMTQEKFINDSKLGVRIYKTGDLARWLSDGNIEYLGRIDEQVKIRGYRIELAEIENQIRKLDIIKDTAVVVIEENSLDKYICAYVVSDQVIDYEQIKDELRKEMPEYMIPTQIVQIDEIPVTKNGKVNKKALPIVKLSSNKEYVEATDEIEEKLVEIFKNILSIDKVGIKDNFFELGGDSIKAIRVVSKIREMGYEITAQDLMKERCIYKIKNKMKLLSDENLYNQEPIYGEVSLTPIQKCFNDWNLAIPEHFNQSVMLECEKFNEDALRATLNELVIHHDILRAVYKKDHLEILNHNECKLYDFITVDFTKLNNEELILAIYNKGTELQQSIDLENGPLVKVGLFKAKDKEYLLICIHHLVVDGISWRILIEDIKSGYEQYLRNGVIVLPKKTASYKEWAEALEEYKDSYNLISEENYWNNIQSELFEGRIKGEKDEVEKYEISVMEFDEELTKELLYNSSKTYNTEINDLLLAALGMAINRVTNQDKVAVQMEGHGREEIHKNIKIDRTVGWFTNIYPIILQVYDDVERNIIQTKEMLRKIPNKGIGYGVLKYNKKAFKQDTKVDLCFNYLGELDEVLDNESVNGNSINSSIMPTGLDNAKENKMSNNLTVNGLVKNKKLQFNVIYNSGKYSETFIESFIKEYKNSLKDIINQCISTKEEIKTASDVGSTDIEDFELDNINALIDDLLE
ncbi:MAG: amino acid adenylation domain-containing protein [Clostridium sp.]